MEEAMDDLESVEQSNVLQDGKLESDQPSSSFSRLPNSESTSQTLKSDLNEQLMLLSEEAELVQPFLIASPHNLPSASSRAMEFLNDIEEELPLKLRLLGKAETIESNIQSSADFLGASEELPSKLSGEAAELVEPFSITSPPNLQSAKDTSLEVLDKIEELPLTLQQREAISRRHPLKFITGHYGSGKVTISHTCNWYMYTRI